MAIRYDKDYNARLRKDVRNFNQRRTRAIKRGFTNLPPAQLVSELKARYTTRSDLDRAVKQLRNFKADDSLRKIETSGGVKAVKWQYQFIKSNVENAKEYFQSEYERVSKRTGKFPGERTYLDTIAAKIDLLNNDINYMTQSQFRSALTAVNEFAKAPSRLKASYRGFLSEVEFVMDKLDIPKEKQDAFFKKFSKLTPTQFLYAYDNNDIIARVYGLYFKSDGEGQITTSDKADEAIEVLMEEADDIIADAKLNSD